MALRSFGRRVASFQSWSNTGDVADAPQHLFNTSNQNAIHAFAILSNLNEQRKNASHYCDLQITTHDQRGFWAHKVILDMFTKYFDEPGRFVLEQVDGKTMEMLLEFIYTGKAPNFNAESSLKIMTSSLSLGLEQTFHFAVVYCVDHIFEVLSANYFNSLSFAELSALPILNEGYLLDKLEESKYRRIIHKWVAVDPGSRLECRPKLETLFSKLWTSEEYERAFAIAISKQGVPSLVQFNHQDRKWYPCEFSYKSGNFIETSLFKAVQMCLYKADHFVFRDGSNSVYHTSCQLKRKWNKNSTSGTFVKSNCQSLKQFNGHIYGLFEGLKKWNGESKKFETVISKESFSKLKFTAWDFTIDDTNSTLYFLGCPQSEENPEVGILNYFGSDEEALFVPFPGLKAPATVLTASDDHLLVYGNTDVDADESESDVYAYDIFRRQFHQDLYLNRTLHPEGSLFRLNGKMYSLTTIVDDLTQSNYSYIDLFPLEFEEAKHSPDHNSDPNISSVKAVCICPNKGHQDAMYGLN